MLGDGIKKVVVSLLMRFFCAVFSSFVFIKSTYFYASKYTSSVLGVFFFFLRGGGAFFFFGRIVV